MYKFRAIAEEIYNFLKEENVKDALTAIKRNLEREKTNKLRFTKTPLLNSIGEHLGKLLLKEAFKYERLLELWKKGERDERLIVIGALGKIAKKDYDGVKKTMLKMLEDISDWESCDQMALRVVTTLALQNSNEIFSMMEEWIKSDNKWLRRLAVATIPPYIRASKNESQICLAFISRAMDEKDREVKKAIAWALREISKKDMHKVFEFLKSRASSNNKNTRWIVKEGMRKLDKHLQDELKSIMERD